MIFDDLLFIFVDIVDIIDIDDKVGEIAVKKNAMMINKNKRLCILVYSLFEFKKQLFFCWYGWVSFMKSSFSNHHHHG